MSYNKKDFYQDDNEAIKGHGNKFKYKTDDSIETVEGDSYFTFDAKDGTDVGGSVEVGSFISVKASNSSRIYTVTSLNPTVLAGASSAPNGSMDGTSVANIDNANAGAIPVVFSIEIAGGSTSDTSLTMQTKIRVIRVDITSKGSGTVLDSFVLRNGTDAITNTVDLSSVDDNQIVSVTDIDKTHRDLDIGDGLSFYEVDGGAGSAPPLSVTVTAVRIS